MHPFLLDINIYPFGDFLYVILILQKIALLFTLQVMTEVASLTLHLSPTKNSMIVWMSDISRRERWEMFTRQQVSKLSKMAWLKEKSELESGSGEVVRRTQVCSH